MIEQFSNLCHELFPSITPYTADNIKKAIEQFKKEKETIDFLSTQQLSGLNQGDIFTQIPFFYTDKNGDVKTIKAQAQLLTNSCDATRKKHLLFSAILPIKEYSEFDSVAIKNNLKYELIYYPDNRLEDQVVDLCIITTISREAFEDLLTENKVQKIASLSSVGYYFWLAKMTVFFMRPESEEIIREKGCLI